MSTLAVVHLDNHLLVVSKPAGVPTVPDASGDESLLELGRGWIAREFAKPGRVFLGVVHRLDRPVSGLVCFARTSKVAERLTRQFREQRTAKRYLAVTTRWSAADEGTLEQWLVKDRATNRVRAHERELPSAKRALTCWRVLERREDRALVELEPRTGRSHQLRVACASLGAPILGDLKYGAREPLEDQSIALHAVGLSFDHPTRGERLAFQCPTPELAVWRSWRTERR